MGISDTTPRSAAPGGEIAGAAPTPVRFVPLRRAGRRRRALLWLIGPILWAGLIVTVALVIHRFYAVELAVAATAAAFLLAVLWLGPSGWRRHRRLSR